MMNTKYKLVRLVVSAAFGSLLWAGCASERTYYTDSSASLRPVNLTELRAHTRPEWRNGSENATWQSIAEVPVEEPTIYEAAGARRP
jgi:hypothetical protein